MQRLVTLGLLTYSDPDEAIELAEKFQADEHLSADMRRDAFQTLLALSPRQKGDQAAAAALTGKDSARQKLALHYFVYGPGTFRELREEIYIQLGREESSSRTSGTPIVPKPPQGLKISQLLPLLDDADPAVAAEAGYLLALLGESRGLEPLLRYAQQKRRERLILAAAHLPCDCRPGRFQSDSLVKEDLRRSQPIRGFRVLLDDPHHDRP